MKNKENMGYTILITIVATIGGFLFGYDSGVINGTVDGLQSSFGSDSVGTGFNVASMLLGCAVGAFVAGQLADRLGRRKILFITAIFFGISAFGSGIATGTFEFVMYRIIGGLAVGAASILAPAYISEIAPAKYRGMLASIQQISILLGIFFSFLFNWLIAKSAGGSMEVFMLDFAAWRWMFWVEIIPSLIFLFALLLIPESPRFLVATGKKEKAITVLTKLIGDEAEPKYNEIVSSLSNDGHKPSLKDIVGKLGFRPIVWIGIGLAFFQQAVGINAVFYYGAVLWQAAGFTEDQSLITNVIGAGVSIFGCIITLLTIERIGRKRILLIGSIGMFIAMGIMGYVFSISSQDINGDLELSSMGSSIALGGNMLFLFFFNFSWGPVMWVLLGEMFPNQIRGSALAVSGFGQWISNFGITMAFPIMLVGLGLGATFVIYSGFALISFFFVMKWVKETKGIELEDMEG
jgi:MFS transporter, SP family, sugar:H+ symporter